MAEVAFAFGWGLFTLHWEREGAFASLAAIIADSGDVMLFISPKRSENIRLSQAAERYITKSYDKQAWNSVCRYFTLFDESHQQMVATSCLFDFEEASLLSFATCLRYYKSIEEKMNAKSLALEFVWLDTLKKKKVKDSSFAFEKANLLFNIGAIYSVLASKGDFSTPDGKKAAMNKYLMAAGCFDKVREWTRELPRIDSLDLTQEHCSYAIYLMIAQGYICMFEFVDKATYNKQSIGKLASAVAKNYQFAVEIASRSPLQQGMARDQIALMEFYSMYYKATGNYWTALWEREQAEQTAKGFGMAVARLRLARQQADQAVRIRQVVGTPMEKGRQLFETIAKVTQESEATNLNVYMDSIVPESTVKPIEDLSMLNPKFPPSVDVESKTQGEECLMVLIPPEVRNVMSQYKERLMEMVRAENVAVADLRTQVQGLLSSLSLPQKLEAISASEAGLPEDVWTKVQEVNSHGGAIQVEKMMESLSVMNSGNLKLLEDVELMIKQEEDDDASHRTMFGPRWNRALSQAGNAMLKQDLFKFREKTAQATAVDRAITQTYQSAQASLQLTRKSREELSAMLPRAAASVDASAPPIAQLRAVLENVSSVEKQIAEELIMLQTMTDSDNIVGEIMQQYTARADLMTVVARELEKYTETRGRIGALKSQVLEAAARVRAADRDFEQFAASVRTSAERVEFLRALALGCEKFKELVNQLSQGMNFYKQLGALIAQLQQRVSDFIIARNLEKNDLVMRLTAGSAPGGYPGYYQNPYK